MTDKIRSPSFSRAASVASASSSSSPTSSSSLDYTTDAFKKYALNYIRNDDAAQLDWLCSQFARRYTVQKPFGESVAVIWATKAALLFSAHRCASILVRNYGVTYTPKFLRDLLDPQQFPPGVDEHAPYVAAATALMGSALPIDALVHDIPNTTTLDLRARLASMTNRERIELYSRHAWIMKGLLAMAPSLVTQTLISHMRARATELFDASPMDLVLMEHLFGMNMHPHQLYDLLLDLERVPVYSFKDNETLASYFKNAQFLQDLWTKYPRLVRAFFANPYAARASVIETLFATRDNKLVETVINDAAERNDAVFICAVVTWIVHQGGDKPGSAMHLVLKNIWASVAKQGRRSLCFALAYHPFSMSVVDGNIPKSVLVMAILGGNVDAMECFYTLHPLRFLLALKDTCGVDCLDAFVLTDIGYLGGQILFAVDASSPYGPDYNSSQHDMFGVVAEERIALFDLVVHIRRLLTSTRAIEAFIAGVHRAGVALPVRLPNGRVKTYSPVNGHTASRQTHQAPSLPTSQLREQSSNNSELTSVVLRLLTERASLPDIVTFMHDSMPLVRQSLQQVERLIVTPSMDTLNSSATLIDQLERESTQTFSYMSNVTKQIRVFKTVDAWKLMTAV